MTTTVASITIDELGGCWRSLRTESQLKVPMLTMIITATSAAIGIRLTQGPRNTTITSRNTPATSADRRPRPPDFTLITDWPIIAQPAMPPMNPVATLARPWPTHSRFLLLPVSVSSSTIAAVIIDSSRPTTASVSAQGAMIFNVARFNGTSGSRKTGRLSGSRPMSPTLRMSRSSTSATPVSTTMVTSGDGTALVRYGRP